jgi:hypothetical protein
MPVGVKEVNAGWDDVAKEIRDKDNVPVGQMVFDHECLKVGAQYEGDFMANAVKICCDSLLIGAFVGCQVDIPKRCRSCGW